MEKIKLLHPTNKSILQEATPRFQWAPLSDASLKDTVHYSLMVFAARSNPRRKSKSDFVPFFAQSGMKRNFLDFPLHSKGFAPGRAYEWMVRAHDHNGRILAISEKRRFVVKKTAKPASKIVVEARLPDSARYITLDQKEVLSTASVWQSMWEVLLPPPPSVWGKPSHIRRRSELESSAPDEPFAPPGDSGIVKPIDLVWGCEGGELYLPYELATNASLYWNLSRIEGCSSVLFQISGSDGFSEPNNGNVMEDEAVIKRIWGPPQIQVVEELEDPTAPGNWFCPYNIDLVCVDDHGGLPSEEIPDIRRYVRVIPCNESREPVDVASDPFLIHCVRNPRISIHDVTAEWSWGDTPRRTVDFSVQFEERFPNVPGVPPATAPFTLLIQTGTAHTMLEDSSCANVSLTMDGEEIPRHNRIIIRHATDYDTYVIPFDEWPSVFNLEFRLVQEWQCTGLKLALLDFLKVSPAVMIIPGIRPEWNYAGGVMYDFDSLYGRDDLPDMPTNSPYYHVGGTCLPDGIIDNQQVSGLDDFNDFMSSTFRGTRTVTYDPDGLTFEHHDGLEVAGVEDVVVHFETGDASGELRYVLPTTTDPVMMLEERAGRTYTWKINQLNGKWASMRSVGGISVTYGSRTTLPGTSWFDPPRLEMWFSVYAGYSTDGQTIYADIHYDLTAD